MTMTNQRAIILLSQMYLPHFDDEEKSALTKAIEVLTEQIPRVLTLKEVMDKYEVVWLETKYLSSTISIVDKEESKSDTDCLCFVLGIDNSYTLLRRTYGKIWRCWSAKPTDEQREGIPWERD